MRTIALASTVLERMKGHLFIFLIFTLLIFGIPGCGSQSIKGVKGRVKVSGSTTVLPLAQEAAFEFMESNPGASVEVQGGGSSVGISQVRQGIVDIGMSSRELEGSENDGLLVDNKIAFDVIVVVVHPSVAIRNLSGSDLKRIFTGKVENWKEVGGPDLPIVVVVRDQASGTREMFDKKALGATKEKAVEIVPSAIECASNGVVRETVASTKGSIGYLSYGYVDRRRVKPVKLDGVLPDLKNASTGRYPLARYLHMFTKGKAKGIKRAYIDFILSEKFQRDVVSLEYIPVRLVERI